MSFVTAGSAIMRGEVGGVVAAAAEGDGDELDQVRRAVARGELHEAEAVPMGVEAHRFGVDGDHRPERETLGQVVPVEVDGAVHVGTA